MSFLTIIRVNLVFLYFINLKLSIINNLKWNKNDIKIFLIFLNFEIFFNKIKLVNNKTINNKLKSIILLNNGLDDIEYLNSLSNDKLEKFEFLIGDIMKIKNYFKNKRCVKNFDTEIATNIGF